MHDDLRLALLDVLPDDPILVEAGAHHGEDTRFFSERAGWVHAFEPVNSVFGELVRNTQDLQNVTPWRFALSDMRRATGMWVSGGLHDASSSLRRPTGHLEAFPELTFETTERVEVTTLRHWVEAEGILVDGLWLDTQGTELDVLKGMDDAISDIRGLVCEVSLTELYEDQPLAQEVTDWLVNEGFTVEKIQWNGPQGDILAVR